MTKVENKKNLLALIKNEEKLKKIYQQYETKVNYNIAFGYRSDLQLKTLKI